MPSVEKQLLDYIFTLRAFVEMLHDMGLEDNGWRRYAVQPGDTREIVLGRILTTANSVSDRAIQLMDNE